jgi:murein DD-endopeptidase MepM/ murein hydrolase activator NlpD
MPSGRARFVLLGLAVVLAPACGTPRLVPPAQPTPARSAPPAARRAPLLAPTFAENRGRLPWPVEGIVVAPFGTRIEPEFGTRTDAPGIDLATPAGAPVAAVFDGRVARVGTIAAYGRYVMLRHGSFATIYGNLSEVSVHEGESVRTGALIARAGTDLERRGAGLFFAVFEGDVAVDPLPWLVPAR